MLIDHEFNSFSGRIVRTQEVYTRLGLSRAKFADMVAKGQFPKPFAIVPGGRAVGWMEQDVDVWIGARAANRAGGVT